MSGFPLPVAEAAPLTEDEEKCLRAYLARSASRLNGYSPEGAVAGDGAAPLTGRIASRKSLLVL